MRARGPLARPRRPARREGALAAFARWSVRNRTAVLAASAVTALMLGLLAAGLADRLSNGGFLATGTESARADALLTRGFDATTPDLVLRAAADRPVDSGPVAEAGARLTRHLRGRSGVARVRSYWDGRPAALRATDGRSALLVVDLAGTEADATRTAERLVPDLARRFAPLRVTATGPAWTNVQFIRQGQDDARKAEVVVAPLAVLILVIAFGSVLASLLPVVVGALAVVGTLAALRLLTHAIEISVFAPNLATALGFGLAIDYSLFIVTRFREELARGLPVGEAVVRSMATAGRTVVFSACTVGLAVSGLFVFPVALLRSLAWAVITVVALAAAATILVLPALLAALGTRVNDLDPFARLRRRAAGAGRRRAVRAARRLVLAGGATAVALDLLPACRRRPAVGAGGPARAALAQALVRALARRPLTAGGAAAVLLGGPGWAIARICGFGRRVAEQESLLWRRVALAAVRRPVALGGGCAVLLLMLTLPFLHVRFGIADERILPVGAEAHATARQIRRDFTRQVDRDLHVVLPGLDAARPGDRRDLADYARRLAALPQVVAVQTATGVHPGRAGSEAEPRSESRSAKSRSAKSRGKPRHAKSRGDAGARARKERARSFASRGATLVVVSGRPDPQSRAAGRLLERVRAEPAPGRRLVSGRTAQVNDTLTAMGRALPAAVAVIAVSTVVLLFLFTGGILVSVKALLLGALSLTASCGAIVAIFQDGRLRGLVGDFALTGHLEAITLVLTLTVAFGLSMDYEVFLLSRIREHHRATGDHDGAVVTGIATTGRLVTAAACVIALTTGSLVLSSNTVLKMNGLGLALAVLVDATLVRGVLVPAFMRLTGPANWWAPAPLARLHRRLGLEEGGDGAPPAGRVRRTLRALSGVRAR
ncbi:MMPL family transporter [Actinomadura namibiensis]|uniref:MMPL family transporter n=1 Tax=Actinomadura kijaniata TaxID=46161 RepID=UPI003612B8A8